MEVSNMLSLDGPQDVHDPSVATNGDPGLNHQYTTRRSLNTNGAVDGRLAASVEFGDSPTAMRSPSVQALKNVSFELSLDGSPNVRGRLPMRVQIFPHDTTDSIVTTVKNFYGLYDSVSEGVNFEDVQGNPVVASFDNLANNMTVYVRVVPELSQQPVAADGREYRAHSPQRMNPLGDGAPMLPPSSAQALGYGQPPSRPGSRVSRRQSVSPKLSQAKVGSAQKIRSRSGVKSQGSSFQAGLDELNSDIHNGYSSSDGGAGSVTSSRMARSEQLATAEISVDNIVEGGRRQKAKFESSELPLFVPPQVPAPNSISSISPQRPPNPIVNPSPLPRPLQHTLSLQPPSQVIPAFGASEQAASAPPTASPFTIPPVPAHGHRLRDRTSGAAVSARSSLGSASRFYSSNILPTPDPTVASCISDEDVALQLMRLGDVSNFSHGRTSGSTFDDGLSGRAEATSSAGSNADSDADDSDTSSQRDLVGPPLKKQRRHTDDGWASFRSYDPTGEHFDPEIGRYDSLGKLKGLKVKKARANGLSLNPPKPLKKPKKISTGEFQQPISPSSLPGQSRKTSTSTINFQHQLQDDEADLSSKPRCQRCRKSKKGCDRQRPCQRCVDAGIGAEGCLSEDEGNGRKGRYGRHMGVSIKREGDSTMADHESQAAGAILTGMSVDPLEADNMKKRKR